MNSARYMARLPVSGGDNSATSWSAPALAEARPRALAPFKPLHAGAPQAFQCEPHACGRSPPAD
jgi:hypothetical protein